MLNSISSETHPSSSTQSSSLRCYQSWLGTPADAHWSVKWSHCSAYTDWGRLSVGTLPVTCSPLHDKGYWCIPSFHSNHLPPQLCPHSFTMQLTPGNPRSAVGLKEWVVVYEKYMTVLSGSSVSIDSSSNINDEFHLVREESRLEAPTPYVWGPLGPNYAHRQAGLDYEHLWNQMVLSVAKHQNNQRRSINIWCH